MAQNDGPTPPVICGKNSGYHMILDAREACNTLTFSWQSSPTREWNIQVIICQTLIMMTNWDYCR